MSLYVTLESTNSHGKQNVFERHLGDPLPKLTNETVLSVQADGDELVLIYAQLSNIPTASRSVVCWFGDMAKFIYFNIKL